ncbi:MAG: HAD hydrolase-like protein [Acholeplasmataceae bacterium]|jgi:phosphoglycolate phosphatase|nr:HAD hydrolase-like protein [Acholeplasmataceae bacterium]
MKYIFWDFNGTILDDAKLCYNILIEMLEEEGQPLVTFDEYLMIFTFPIKAYYSNVFDFDKTSFEELAHRFIKRYQPRSLSCKIHHGVLEMIKHYESLGYINVLLSASEETNLIEQLTHFKIKELFSYILGTKNIYAKTKLDVAKQFIQTHTIDPKDIIMIGDTLHDAEIADELGCKIIIYTKGHQHQSRFSNYQIIDSFLELKHLI